METGLAVAAVPGSVRRFRTLSCLLRGGFLNRSPDLVLCLELEEDPRLVVTEGSREVSL